MDMGRASCLRVQRASCVRTVSGPHAANEMGSMACRFVRAQESHSPLRRPGSRCTPAYHVKHSPQSRWIVGAASLNERIPRCSPQLDLQSKTDIGHPGLYATCAKPSGVPMPARMYLFVPTYQGLPPPAPACQSLLSDQDTSLSDWRPPPAVSNTTG
jgi:hypothetical protein